MKPTLYKILSLLIVLLLALGVLPARPAQARKFLANPSAAVSLVKDINNDPSSTSLAGLAQIGNTLFISANDITHGYELWKTDGTTAGTAMVKDIIPGANSGFPYSLGVVNDHLFFQADDGTNSGNTEIWVSDGTEAGTHIINYGTPHQGVTGFYPFALLGTSIMFATGDDAGLIGDELFLSESPYDSMTLVKNINTESNGGGGDESSSPNPLVNVNGTIFFSAAGTAEMARELWKSDGTPAGTVLVKDINPAPFSTSNPQALIEANNLLFFQADDGVHGTELWKSDGTEAGTQMVMDIFPGDNGGVPPTPHTSAPGPQIEFDNFLYFTAIDGVHGAELWRTNGTTTELVKDIYLGGSSGLSNIDTPFCFTIINGGLFFGARDADHGMELWKTDGTESGTNLFMDINPGAGDSDPCDFVQNNGITYFIADDGDGEELWQTDGTPAGTFRITNLNGPGGTIYSLQQLNGNLYFFWDDGVHGEELWQAVPPQPTTTTITADTPDPSYPNQSVSISVTVSGSLATPTGTVDITGADTNCQITLSAGTGSCNVVFSTPGKKTLTATYNGDSTSLTSAATEIHQVIATKTFRSTGAQDGWVLESGENTNAGGTMGASATTFRLGDDTARRQYRAILSFNTSSLPDNAVIVNITLIVKQQGITGGGNPVNIFQGFLADVRKGFFGNAAALQPADWQAAANQTVGPLNVTPAGGWYTLNLTTAKARVNKLASNGGVTQIRLRFQLDDNNNAASNFLSLFSGNAGTASRPQLIIEYYIP